jgi:O-antigen/teichoic acid export membrane protein
MRAVVGEARGMGLASVPFLAQSLISGISTDADLWFVQAMRGSAAAGFYGAAAALAEIPTFLFAALSRVLFPSVAKAGAENDEDLVARYASQGVRLALLVTVLGVAVIYATGGTALALVYGATAAVAAVPFTVLMVASVGRTVRATCTDVMMARGQRGEALTIVIAMTIAEIVLLAWATSAFGQIGAAASAAVAGLAAAIAACLVLRELLGWRVVWTVLRASIAAAIVGVGLALLHPSRLWLIPAYVVAALAYALLLRLFGEIDQDDINSLRRAVASAE